MGAEESTVLRTVTEKRLLKTNREELVYAVEKSNA
jgi:hypothetical protein